MHPLRKLLNEWLPELDFAVLAHGFAPHGRDYIFIIEEGLGINPGQHELTFTHCVRLDYETRVSDDVWPTSWQDDFLEYERWQDAGEPAGYVWGTNWSNAYPGITAIGESTLALEWSRRLNKEMFEMIMETDRFFIRLVFHNIRTRKISDHTNTISKVTIPLE
jgi:hypothetical protein